MDNTENEQWELTVLGQKLTATKIAILATVTSTVIGFLWAGFQVWHKIDSYVAPDMEAFEKRIVILEENTAKVNDYTRDIKNDLKNEIRALDTEVKIIRNDSRAMQKEARDDVREIRKEVDIKIKRALDNP
jgi:vacuolar-type H+-ATPase subunit F/Vma7